MYRRRLALFTLLVVGVSTGYCQEKPKGKVVADTWNAAFLSGHHSGWVHNITRELEVNGAKVYRTQSELELHVGRETDNIRLRMITGTEETPNNKVTGLFMQQFLGQAQQMVTTGDVVGEELLIKVDQAGGQPFTKKIAWNTANLGLRGQDLIFRERKVKSGDKFTYQSFEPVVNNVLTTHAEVKSTELVKTLDKAMNLLRVELTSDKLDDGKTGLQMPPMTVWLDKNYDIVRSDTAMEMLGQITLHRTSKAVATNLPIGKPAVNIGLNSLIKLDPNFRINQPYDAEQATYRITVRDDEHPETTFAKDSRQSIQNQDGNSFDLVIQASPIFAPGVNEAKPGEEYLKSNYFITSDDAKVQKLTRLAVGPTTDPWQKALNIERYVNLSIKDKNFKEAFATAAQVAKTLEGDCTEHAVLAAAMARAAGIPSRTAVGLIYVDHRQQGPVMGFHMWAEVYIDGHWRPIDGTLGRGFVGATHLKIRDQSWHDVQGLAPLLPVYRVLGKLDIKVRRVQMRAQ
ncbi:hypothetical protein BH10PLA2_BH10PLA2_08410 [soil metagenome]